MNAEADHYEQGRAAFDAEQYAEAAEAFKAVVQADLNNWDARLYLGMTQVRLGDLSEASKTFRLVHQRCPAIGLRLKAMKALESIEEGLSTGQMTGSISSVIKKPTEEGLRQAYEASKAPVAVDPSESELDLEAFEEMRKKRAKRSSGSHHAAAEESDSPLAALPPLPSIPEPILQLVKDSPDRKPLVPAKIGVPFILIVLLGVVYHLGSYMIPDMYNRLFLKPSKAQSSGYTASAPYGVSKELISFTGPFGVQLNGMLVQTGSKMVVLVNRATTGNLGDDWPLVEQLAKAGYSVFIYDYRGFGKSEGTPDVQGLIGDGLIAYDHLLGRLRYHRDDVILYGRGVGAGVAAEIAKRRTCRGVVLVSGYPNLHEVARARNPLLNIYAGDALPKESYDAAKWGQKHEPALLLTADDPMIPANITSHFYQKVTDPKKVEPLKGTDYEPVVRFIRD